MRWNWQLPDWPDFTWDPTSLREAEARFLTGAGVVVGTMHHLDDAARSDLVVTLISQETVDSSAIEGELLDRASALHHEFRQWIESDASRTPVSYQSAFIGFVRRWDAKHRHELARR